MKIFMDTANVDEIAEFVDWGVVYGVTTNPSLIAKSGRTQAEVIPCIAEGLKAVKVLSAEGIKTNVTLVFSMSQALLAARAGAAYVSPFVGRLDDIGEDGVQLVENIVKAFKLYGIETQVIAASIRNLEHVDKVMLTGCQIATIPTKVLRQMIKHQLTDKGLAQFMADYENSKK